MQYSSNLTYITPINNKVAKQIGNKGWSFSYVYHFSEIRDIYLTVKQHRFNGLADFTNFCISSNLPYTKTPWNKRRILENLNALINFELIDRNYEITKSVFNDSSIGNPITDSDLKIFKNIFLNYFRFKELHSWFIDLKKTGDYEFISQVNEADLQTNSKVLFTYANNGKFTDTFYYNLPNNLNIYRIDPDKYPEMLRFWDVYIKWGKNLKFIEKLNLNQIKSSSRNKTSESCVYIINNQEQNIDMLSFIRQNFIIENYIYLPDLVLKLIQEYRIKVETAHKLIIAFYKTHKDIVSFERTSEIFIKRGTIKENEIILFLKYNEAYVSHLILRK